MVLELSLVELNGVLVALSRVQALRVDNVPEVSGGWRLELFFLATDSLLWAR